jgi:spermidine/putrescine-binding protein
MFSDELKDKGYWLVLGDEKEDTALLTHGWVMLKAASSEMDKVKQFIEFLSTPAAKAVFHDFGYISP